MSDSLEGKVVVPDRFEARLIVKEDRNHLVVKNTSEQSTQFAIATGPYPIPNQAGEDARIHTGDEYIFGDFPINNKDIIQIDIGEVREELETFFFIAEIIDATKEGVLQ